MGEDVKAKPSANYDPALFPLPSNCALVTYSNESGEDIDFLLIPLSDDSPPEDQTAHAYEIQQRADDIIDLDKLVNPEKVISVARGIADCAAIIVATNVGAMYMRRSSHEESTPAVAITLEGVTLPKTEGEADTLITRAIVEHVTTTIGAKIFSNAQQALDGCTLIWRHVYSSVLFTIEREHGDLDGISRDTMDSFFSKYYDRDLASYFQRALLSYAALIAAPYLENLNPASWHIEQLRAFVGMELSDEISPSGTTVEILSANYLSELPEVLKESPEPRGDIAYLYSNGQINLHAAAGNKIAALNQVNRKRGGDRRKQWKKDLWSEPNLKEYTLLVKELAPKWIWLKSNEYDPNFSTPQEWVDDVRQRRDFKGLLGQYKKLTDALLLRVTDGSLSESQREPTPLACFHAAHELGIIEAYERNGEDPPPVNTLVDYYTKGLKLIP